MFKEMDNQKTHTTRKRRIAGWVLHKAGEGPVLRWRGGEVGPLLSALQSA